MLNINGVWVDPTMVQAVLPDGSSVHISLSNGASYSIPGDPGVSIEFTTTAIVQEIEFAAREQTREASSIATENELFNPEVSEDDAAWNNQPRRLSVTPISHETRRDMANEKYHHDGWFAALQEVNLQRLNGTLEMFLDEALGRKAEESQPTLDLWSASGATPAASSGEPEKEASKNLTASVNEGVVTLPYDDYQDGLDEAYNKGRLDGLTDTRQTTGRTLAKMVQEIVVDAGGNPPNSLTLAKKLLPRLGFTVIGE